MKLTVIGALAAVCVALLAIVLIRFLRDQGGNGTKQTDPI